MALPQQRIKIVCTIGLASAKPEVLARMMRAGMNVCRLNFAHGDFASHAASSATGCSPSICPMIGRTGSGQRKTG